MSRRREREWIGLNILTLLLHINYLMPITLDLRMFSARHLTVNNPSYVFLFSTRQTKNDVRRRRGPNSSLLFFFFFKSVNYSTKRKDQTHEHSVLFFLSFSKEEEIPYDFKWLSKVQTIRLRVIEPCQFPSYSQCTNYTLGPFPCS
jgi:hypothetical protein